MHWDANDGKLKERRAKRVELRVSTSSDYKTILENAEERWKSYWKNLYQEGKEYALLYEDGQLLCFCLDLIRKLSVLKGTKRTC